MRIVFWLLLVFSVLWPSGVARAHIGVQPLSLNRLLAKADLVVVGRVVSTDRIYRRPDLAFQQPYIEIKVLEEIKGRSIHRRIDFFGHGHGIARYRPGEEALFFFAEIARHPSWKGSPLAERFIYFSDQEVRDKFVLTAENRGAWIGAAKRYLEVQSMPPSAEVGARLRAITLDLIGSGEKKLALQALHDVLAVPNVYAVFSEDEIDRLKRLAETSAVHLRIRILLCQQLGAAPGFPVYDKVMSLYGEAAEVVDKVAAIRALSRCRDARLVGFLKGLLGDADPSIRRAAIDGLGRPGLGEAVRLLADLLADPDPPLHAALTGALGRIGTEEAFAALRRLSRRHPNKTVRQYARAELRRKERGSAGSATSQPASAPAFRR